MAITKNGGGVSTSRQTTCNVPEIVASVIFVKTCPTFSTSNSPSKSAQLTLKSSRRRTALIAETASNGFSYREAIAEISVFSSS